MNKTSALGINRQSYEKKRSIKLLICIISTCVFFLIAGTSGAVPIYLDAPGYVWLPFPDDWQFKASQSKANPEQDKLKTNVNKLNYDGAYWSDYNSLTIDNQAVLQNSKYLNLTITFSSLPETLNTVENATKNAPRVNYYETDSSNPKSVDNPIATYVFDNIPAVSWYWRFPQGAKEQLNFWTQQDVKAFKWAQGTTNEDITSLNVSTYCTSIPEPASGMLFGIGIAAMAIGATIRQKRKVTGVFNDSRNF